MSIQLDLYQYRDNLKIKNSHEGKVKVFDPVRKKEVVLQPEELVRQLVIQFLLEEQSVPIRKIQVEKQLKINEMSKRYDVIVYDKHYKPALLIECKSYKIKLNQSTFRQIASYNLALKVPFLMITNGLESYFCKMDYSKNNYHFLEEFPSLN